jgi:tetratricopeptide (TPR) repeat protein
MKLLTILLATLILLFTSSPQESPELKQAAELDQSMARLFREGKYDEALPLAKRSLEIRERLLPRNDPRIGTSLNNLGETYLAKRDYGKARDTFQRLLQFQTEQLGAENVKLAPTLERLGLLHFRAGDQGKAQESYERAVALKEKEYGPEGVQTADSLYALAGLFRARRDFNRASPIFRRALMIYGKTSGVSSAEFERTGEAYSCTGLESQKDVSEEISEIWQLFASPDGPILAPAGTVLNGKALSLPKPHYTDVARKHRVAGTVVIKILIDETGKVIKARDMCNGSPYLVEECIKAAYLARFSPTKLSGQPVQVAGVIQYNFVAQ